MRETYTEFQEFEAGTYYMYVKLEWNGKAGSKTYAVNCYSPSKCNWLADDTENWDNSKINELFLN